MPMKQLYAVTTHVAWKLSMPTSMTASSAPKSFSRRRSQHRSETATNVRIESTIDSAKVPSARSSVGVR